MFKDNNSGIYCITCLINNKKYIGSTKNFRKRFRKHIFDLNKGKGNYSLKKDWNSYGEKNFIFEVLEYCEYNNDILIVKEDYYMNKYKTFIPKYGEKYGYNYIKAGRITKHGIESMRNKNKKNSSHLKNKEFTEIHKERISKTVKGYGNGNAKYSREQCLIVKKLCINKNNCKTWKEREVQIFEITGVSQRVVNQIRLNKHWICKEGEENEI